MEITEIPDSVSHKIISPIPVEKMCVINSSAAAALVEQRMGELQNDYELGMFKKQSFTGKFTITEFNGNEHEIDFHNQIVYVAPLEHRSFWKWKRNQTAPGYALVNAAQPFDFYLVHKVNGKEVALKYSESAYFGNNIKRYVRSKVGNNVRMDDFDPELDENGRLHFVITRLENTIGFGGDKAVGSIIVDMESGGVKEYDLEHTPSFVNLVQPQSLIEDYIYYWGEYPHAWLDWTDKDRKKASTGMDIVADENGCSFYVGIQRKTSGEDKIATIGFLKVNTITGKAEFFKREGINEKGARAAMMANQTVASELKLNTIYLDDAVFYNIEGLETYFATFVGVQDKLPKYFAFCNAFNKEIVGVGATFPEAKAAYLKSYYLYKQKSGEKSSDSYKEVKNRILTIKEKVQENNCYFFKFKETGDTTFYTFGELEPEARWKAEKITASYRQGVDSIIVLNQVKIIQ